MLKIPATLACILLIVFLCRVDRKDVGGFSNAIWVPFIWMLFAESREISFWTHYWLGIGQHYGSTEEGNPYERFYSFVLIAASVTILMKRRLNWQELFRKNIWIWAYFIFAAISFFWSDYPLVSFKRWIRALENVLLVLIILSETQPYGAIGWVLRRTAIVLLPLSVLFIRYYPDLGKVHYGLFGTPSFTGVSGQKNSLGALCLICGIYFAWQLLLGGRRIKNGEPWRPFSVYVILLPMIAWLLLKANSATSLACFVAGLFLLIIARQTVMVENPQRFLIFCISCIAVLGLLDLAFDAKDTLIAALGRRPDLTTRVPMWHDLLTMACNPIIGCGYDSFWLGARQAIVIEHWGLDRQAHNGYLDMYLNTGIIGLFFVLAWTLSGLRKVYRHLMVQYPNAVLRLCLILIFVIYNWTETAFYGSSPMLLLFLLGIIDPPSSQNLAH